MAKMTKDELLALAKELATPIDLNGLVSAGILAKRGAWYAVLDFGRLPTYARRQVLEMQGGPDGPVLVKFRSSNKKARAVYARLKR